MVIYIINNNNGIPYYNNNYTHLDYEKDVTEIEIYFFEKVNKQGWHDGEWYTVTDKNDMANLLAYINSMDILKKEKILNTRDYAYVNISIEYNYKDDPSSEYSSKYDNIIISNNCLYFMEDPQWDGDYVSYRIGENKKFKDICNHILNICPNAVPQQ